ncbi:MAG: dihydroorotase [Pseudanabaenaceae cyanobacterium bins.68]|nr:dihydroorotase [Pseudanabaenaceae cyanobacterium bins.68]
MSLLIQQSQVLLPDGEIAQLDLLVNQGKIAAIAAEIPLEPAYHVIDGKGLFLLPGVIDPQVHFREPGLEHKEDLTTASHACAQGGVTSFLEMPNTRPLTTNQAALDHKLALAAAKSVVNYGFFIGATKDNLPDLLTAKPVCGIKIFMGSMHGDLLVDQATALEQIFAHGDRLIAVHAEDQARISERRKLFANRTDVAVHSLIQDNQAALNATQLAVGLALKYHRRLHILHMSTAEEVEFLRHHKTDFITAEVTPQHLFLNTSDYDRIGSFAQMNPPLRSPADNQALWEGLLDGTVDLIATDHAPHTITEKEQPYPKSPSGMPGVETSLAVMLTGAKQGKYGIADVSRWMSSNVAKAYKIQGKGEIRLGWDADLILVNMNEYQPVLRKRLLTKCGWSPFEGCSLTGWVHTTIVGGQVVYAQGEVNPNVHGRALEFAD